MLFLEADEATLQTRYKETRRRHPLAPRGSVADGIARERELLTPLRNRADVVIDTSGLTAAMLRRKLTDEMLPSHTPGRSEKPLTWTATFSSRMSWWERR